MITAVPYATEQSDRLGREAASTGPAMLHDNRLYVSQK